MKAFFFNIGEGNLTAITMKDVDQIWFIDAGTKSPFIINQLEYTTTEERFEIDEVLALITKELLPGMVIAHFIRTRIGAYSEHSNLLTRLIRNFEGSSIQRCFIYEQDHPLPQTASKQIGYHPEIPLTIRRIKQNPCFLYWDGVFGENISCPIWIHCLGDDLTVRVQNVQHGNDPNDFPSILFRRDAEYQKDSLEFKSTILHLSNHDKKNKRDLTLEQLLEDVNPTWCIFSAPLLSKNKYPSLETVETVVKYYDNISKYQQMGNNDSKERHFLAFNDIENPEDFSTLDINNRWRYFKPLALLQNDRISEYEYQGVYVTQHPIFHIGSHGTMEVSFENETNIRSAKYERNATDDSQVEFQELPISYDANSLIQRFVYQFFRFKTYKVLTFAPLGNTSLFEILFSFKMSLWKNLNDQGKELLKSLFERLQFLDLRNYEGKISYQELNLILDNFEDINQIIGLQGKINNTDVQKFNELVQKSSIIKRFFGLG